jgi:hypothetical protein
VDKEEARAQILLSGSGDFVSLAEAAGYVRHELPTESPAVVKTATLEAITDLLRDGLIRVGDLAQGFVAWERPDVVAEIDRRWTKSDRELAPWDGIWLANTPTGDRLADELAGDGRVTRRGHESG